MKRKEFSENYWLKKSIIFYRKSIVIILFFIIWELLARFGIVSQFILPTVISVLEMFKTDILNGKLFMHTSISLQRTGTGFLAANIIGIILGMLMGWFTKLEKYLDPLLQLFRNTSVLAMFPVFILLFGLGEASKVAIVFWGSLWPVLLNTIGGVKGVDPIFIKSAKSMGISTYLLFKKVILPAALPEILTGIRLSAGVAIIILVAAEMLGASKGLGFLIFNSQTKYDVQRMFMGIITISTLGMLVNCLLVKLELRLVSWKASNNPD